ncbi:hypothetical protein F4824DRAFT_269725 [Ustulina deusta]|nr:hypothetical protein F4824DRAFT_269725 [Ustulina deusta]
MATTQQVKDRTQPSPPSSASPAAPTLTARDTATAETRGPQRRYGPSAAILDWILLAGSIIFPDAMPLNQMRILGNPAAAMLIQSALRNVPRRYMAASYGLLLIFGMAWLWWTLRYNYLRLIIRILIALVCSMRY